MDVLIGFIIILIIVGVAYWAAGALGLPHPIPTLILVVGIAIALIFLIGNIGELSGDGVDDEEVSIGFA